MFLLLHKDYLNLITFLTLYCVIEYCKSVKFNIEINLILIHFIILLE